MNTTEIPEINPVAYINNLSYADNTPLIEDSEEELKSFLMRVNDEGEKPGLKLSIQKNKIMVSGPTTLWHIVGEKVEAVVFFCLGHQKYCGG